MASLSLNIDPGRAVAGARVVRRELTELADAADKTERAFEDTSDAASDMGSGLDRAGKEARDAARDIQTAGKSAKEAASSIGKIGSEGARVGREVRDGSVVVRRSVEQINGAAIGAQRSIGRTGSVANDNFRAMATGAGLVTRAVDGLRNAYAGLLAGVSLAAFAKMTDQFTSLTNVLRVVAGEQGDVNAIIDQLNGIATRTRTPLEAIATLYQRTSVAAGDLGASQKDVLRFTENVGLALAQQGGSAEQASGALLQLAQTLGGGTVQAEEFNSILDGAYPIALAAAKGIDAAGGSVGKLRKLVLDGKVSSKEFFDAILSQSSDLEKKFGGTTATLSQSFTVLSDNVSVAIGRLNQSLGITSTVSSLMLALSGNLDLVAKAAVVAGVALLGAFSGAAFAAVRAMTAAIGTQLVAAMNGLTAAIARNPLGAIAVAVTTAATAVTLFRDEIHPIAGEIATLGDYFRAIGQIGSEAFSGAAAQANTFANDALTAVLSFLGQANAEVNLFPTSWDQAWAEIKSVFSAAVQRLIETFAYIPAAGEAAKAAFIAAFDNLPEQLKFVAEGAVNTMIATINYGLRAVASAIGATPIQIEPVKRTMAEAGQSVGEAFSTTLVQSQQETVAKINGVMGSIGQAFGVVRKKANEIGEGRMSAENLATGLDTVAKSANGAGAATDDASKKVERATKAFEDQRRSIAETAADLQRQIDTFDASEGATARLEFTTREMARAWDIAREAGLKAIPPETLNAINAAAGQVEVLTDKLNAMRLVRSAEDEFFPFEKANREAAELRDVLNDTSLSLSDTQRAAVGLAIDKKFKDAASAADGLRTKGVKAGQDIGQSFIDNVGDVFADIFSSATRDGESFFSSILRGVAGLGSQLAAAGAKSIFGKLFGFGTDKSAAGIGGIGGIGSAGSYSPPVAANSNYNPSAVSSAPLMALNDNLSKASRSALDVAKQFSGLNEKADSRVLDGFLQASGNWKGLSARDTAWCAAFANASIMQAGGQGTGSNLASSFLNWGSATNQPKVGDVVVLRPQSRGASGHVGFVAGFGDGTVQVFGGNQSNSAKVSNFSTREVVGYRTGAGTQAATSSMPYGFDQRALQRATSIGVKDGLTDYSRQASYGDYVQAGVDPWNSGGQNLRGGPAGFGQTAFGALGAGLGIFGQGYQSGSPLQGGFSGALGGYQAAGALGFTSVGAGIAGGVLGAGLGILGGILGARKQREQEHRQKASAWEQMRPAYEEFDRSLSGEKQGDLRKYVTEGWGQLSSFMSTGGAAWKYGQGNSTAQFDSTGRKLFEGFLKMLGDFRDGFDSMITDMSSGQGLQGAFAKGRNATKELADQIKKTRDDVDIAFGNIASIDFLNTPGAQAQAEETAKSRADTIARYNDAAAKYALSLLYSAEKFSDVQQTIDGLRGTAAGLVPIFADLGWNADDAAKAINDRLSAAIANIARELEQTLADRIDDLNGKGYFATVRDFLDEYAGLQRDFAAAGADGSRLPEFFKLQAQEIVNGAKLTGDAFAELIRLFPDLSGVVVEAGKAVGASASEIADAIKGYEERLFDAQNGSNELARIERKLAADRIEAAKFGADALAMFEKAAAAERANAALSDARNVLDRSYQAETDRINDLLSARRDEASELESTISKLESFRDQVKEFRDSLKLDDNLSTLNAQDRVTEAGRQFRDLLAKARGGDEDAQGRLTGAAQEYLNEAKGYYQTSTDYGAIFEEVNRALADTQTTTENALSVSQSQLDALKRQITLDEQQLATAKSQYDAILGVNEGIKSLEVAFREYAAAAAAARAAGVVVPGNSGGGGGGGGGSSSGGADYDAPRRPGVDVSSQSAKYLSNNADVAAAIKAGETFGLPAGMPPEVYASAHFGLHGQTEGRKWATGGHITGPGTGTSDSIPIWASNGEFMMREAAVTSVGVGTMDYINRTGRLPTIAMPASPRMVGSGNDNRGIEQRLDAMQRTLIALTTTTGGGLQRVAEAGEAGARATEQRALAERRSANNKQAA